MTDYLQYIIPTAFMGIGGIITWMIKSQVEELRAVEERLREDRRKVYLELLRPYIMLLSNPKDRANIDKCIKKVKSVEYKEVAFSFNLFASDEAIEANNRVLKQANQQDDTKADPKKYLELWGNLILELRKSLGNKNTKLHSLDMLKFMISDY
jgi:hypothetical protein